MPKMKLIDPYGFYNANLKTDALSRYDFDRKLWEVTTKRNIAHVRARIAKDEELLATLEFELVCGMPTWKQEAENAT